MTNAFRSPIFLGLSIILWLLLSASYGQSLLQAGPMNGYSDLRETAVWVQTKASAQVAIRFWQEDKPTIKKTSQALKTEKSKAFAATIIIDSLMHGTTYAYELLINGKPVKIDHPLRFRTQTLWQHRSDPPSFSFVAGSCTYVNEPTWDRPGKPYGDSMMVFETINKLQPDFMLWVGDNAYTREGDWNTRSGFQHRYTHTRSLKEMQALLGNTHHYATWDDHDYGPNDSDRGFANKQIASETFFNFWPTLPGKPLGEGPVCQTFQWNDCQFFMLDDRWFRAPNNDKDSTRPYFGEAQINWLIDALTYSKANFKFICSGGQIINPARTKENYAIFPVERRQLLDRITKAEITGVFFITGDRHHTELSKLNRPGTYPLYDLTTSPLTSGTHNPGNEGNYLRVPGTLYTGRNFAHFTISGTAKSRTMKIDLRNNLGEVVWTKEIAAAELK